MESKTLGSEEMVSTLLEILATAAKEKPFEFSVVISVSTLLEILGNNEAVLDREKQISRFQPFLRFWPGS